MTDFLTSLAARSFGSGTVIRPRVASLFEPVHHADAAVREGMAEPIETTIAREVDVESHARPSVIRSARPLREEDNAKDAKRTANEGPVSAVVPRPQADSAHRKITVSTDEGPEDADTVVATAVRPLRMLPSRQQERQDSNESDPSQRAAFENEVWKHVSPRAPAASSLREEFDVEQENRGLVLPSKEVTDLAAQMKDTALAMKVGTAKQDRAGRALPALAAESEPSVHITIGRIEVRATSESKHAGRPRATSPVMSLEEYLRQRTLRGGQ